MNENQSSGLAIGAAVISVAGLVFSVITLVAFWGVSIGVILGIVGLILGIVSRRQNGNSSAASVGVICGILAIVVGIILAILVMVGVFATAMGL